MTPPAAEQVSDWSLNRLYPAPKTSPDRLHGELPQNSSGRDSPDLICPDLFSEWFKRGRKCPALLMRICGLKSRLKVHHYSEHRLSEQAKSSLGGLASGGIRRC